jgi:hypothetical protein
MGSFSLLYRRRRVIFSRTFSYGFEPLHAIRVVRKLQFSNKFCLKMRVSQPMRNPKDCDGEKPQDL